MLFTRRNNQKYFNNYDIKYAILDIDVISQETELFNMSIEDNLCLNKKLSDNEIEIYLRELEYK